MKILFVLLLCWPMLAELNDPGAGLADRATRRAARLAVWQPAWESYTAEQKQDAAREAVEDMWDGACLLAGIRAKVGDPEMSIAAAREWAEDRIAALTNQDVLDLIVGRCDPPTGWTPEELEQGPLITQIVVIRTQKVSEALRTRLPVIPRIGSVAPFFWGTQAVGTCVMNGQARTYCSAMQASQYLGEAQRDLLESIARAELGAENVPYYFALVDSLYDVQWQPSVMQ